MNYTQKTFEELLETVLEDSVENGLISHAEDFLDLIDNRDDISNYYVMDKSVIVNLIASIVYPDITSVYESSKAEYAEGEDLDDIGITRGIPRPVATASSVEATFTLLTPWKSIYEEDISIPSGEITLVTDDGIEFETVEDLYLTKGNDIVTVQCMSKETGHETKISANTLVNIKEALGYEFIVNNPESSSGGEDAYNDDEYRYLLLNWFKVHLKGSLEAYENYFANFEGIDGYKLVPNWDSSGTMKIILDPGTPYLLNKAYEEIKASVCQADEIITMFPPTEKVIDIYAMVNVDIDQVNPYNDMEKQDIQKRILQAIKVFIDGGYMVDGTYYPGLLIGEDFIPHKLAVFLDDEIPELKNITFTTPNDYIQVLDEEIGVSGNLTIEMM
ncbi:baseplate J/gp47 family protein [Methanobrevibacter sp.]